MRLRALGLACYLAAAPSVAAAQGVGAKWAVDHVAIVDVANGQILRDHAIAVDDNRIRAIASSRDFDRSGRRVIDGHGAYVIPGLWDMHAHLVSRLPDGRNAGDELAPLLLANGVVGIRDMGAQLDEVAQWRAAARAGRLPIRLFASGPILNAYPMPNGMVVRTPEAARRAVDSLADAGVDFIKVYSYLSRSVFLAIVEEAKHRRLPFAGHLPNAADSTIAALDLGMRSVEHSWGMLYGVSSEEVELRRAADSTIAASPTSARAVTIMEDAELRAWASFDSTKLSRLIDALRRDHAFVAPTVSYWRMAADFARDSTSLPHAEYATPALRAMYRAQAGRLARRQGDDKLAEMHRDQESLIAPMAHRGVTFLAGTDGAAIPGFSLHDELALLVADGLTPLQALQAATINGARALDATDSLGVVAAGKVADFVLLDGNPLEDIHNTTRIRGVSLNGRFFDRAALDAMLAPERAKPGQ